MDDQVQDGILRRRNHLLSELTKVHRELGLPLPNGRGEPDGLVFDLAPSQAIRRLLADRRTPLERGCIAWALIKGNARVGTKHAEQNILRAIEVNVELGLLVERDGKIALPEWKFYERPWRREVKDPRVRLAMERMHTHLGTGISIAKIAGEVGLSPSRFTHLFEEEVTISPKEYMRRIRMRVVREMLISTHLKQKQILGLVGISDRSNFSRAFKRFFKSNPTSVRRQHFKRDRLK